MYRLGNIIGLSVVAVKSDYRKSNYKINSVSNYRQPKYIMFSDGITYIKFEDINYYNYHDASSCAKIINVIQDATKHNEIMQKADSNEDI